MHKETVKYTDFDDQEQEASVYFNLTRAEMLEQQAIIPDMEAMLAKLQAFAAENPDTEEVPPDIANEIRYYVKFFMGLAYGIKDETPDGLQMFNKSEHLWHLFQKTAVYDELLFDILTDATRATNFFSGIMPKQLQNMDAIAAGTGSPQDQKVLTYEDYSREQLVAMPQHELDQLVGTDPAKWPREVMMVQYQRKAGGNGSTTEG